MAKLNHQMIHIICEVVIFICLIFYFTSKNTKLYRHIQELTHRIEEHEETIQKLLADVKKLKEEKSVSFQESKRINEQKLLQQQQMMREREIMKREQIMRNQRELQMQENQSMSHDVSNKNFKPIANQTEPVLSQPQPVVSQPQPVVSQPQPVVSQPEPVVSQSEPVVSQPQSEPIDNQPESVIRYQEKSNQQNTSQIKVDSDDGHGTGENMLNEDDLDRELEDELKELE